MAPPRHVWSLPLARVTAGATLVLIMAGGLVTTTGAGLAVPDWPTTFGENLFLFPWSRMVGGVLVEHSHRLLGVVVGCLTLGLGAAVWLEDRRDSARGLAGAAVALVAIQGLVGGLRVVLVRDVLALIHGCLAQAFFALLAALVVVTGVRRRVTTAPGSPERPGRGLAALAGLATIVVYGQIVLGAFATHEGWVLGHVGGLWWRSPAWRRSPAPPSGPPIRPSSGRAVSSGSCSWCRWRWGSGRISYGSRTWRCPAASRWPSRSRCCTAG